MHGGLCEQKMYRMGEVRMGLRSAGCCTALLRERIAGATEYFGVDQ